MLVPRFALAQTEAEVVVTVKLPYVRVGDAELSVDGQDLAFYCKPYLLKLHFPHALRGSEEDEGRHCRAVYDADLDHGTMTLHLAKAQPGQDFPDLDLTTSLLQPVRAFDPKTMAAASSGNHYEPPRIEVLRSEEYITPPSAPSPSLAEEGAGGGAGPAATTTAAAAAADGKGGAQPQPGSATKGLLPLSGLVGVRAPRYGFNRGYSGVFRHLREEVAEVLRVPDPEGTPEGLRTLLREAEEAAQFDGERYLGDLVDGDEDPVYQEAMGMAPFYLLQESSEGEGEWTAEEREELAGLTNRAFLPFDAPEEARAVALGLLDLLLAFTYDHRTTGGEPTVESCWTLATLSPALCWLETYHPHPHPHAFEEQDDDGEGTTHPPPPPPPSAAAVVRTFYRRSLTYPYLRCWALSARCVADARDILLRGADGDGDGGGGAWASRRLALRCLLRVRRTLRRTEAHYLLNRIFLDDYCAFLQQRERAEPVLALLRAELRGGAAAVGKGDVGLDLLGLEALLVDDSESGSDSSEEGGRDSEGGSSGTDESSDGDDDEEDEEEEEEEQGDGDALVAGLQRVRLAEDQPVGPTLEGQEEDDDNDEDAVVVGKLGALSVGGGGGGDGGKPRETLDVRPPPSLLLAPARREEDGEEEEGVQGSAEEGERRRRPLVEEIA